MFTSFDDKLHEECGVFGVYSSGNQVANMIYYGLVALQHRGQESAGMSVTDTNGPKGNIVTKKGMGLVNEVFSGDVLKNISGNMGIGHVRYSTTGGSLPENAQPIAMNYIKGNISIVHNGNIMNAIELKERQMKRGQAHYTTSDTEVLAYEIISERLKCDSIEEAVKNASKSLKGGYACIIMSPRKLVAIRDPKGIKPLVIGKKGDDYIVASESAAIVSVGGELIRDVMPGEIITISENGLKSDYIINDGHCGHCIFEYIYFARIDSIIDGVSVYDARLKAGAALARSYKVDADIVVGVPDSGIAAAIGYSKESGIPFSLAFHKNSYIGRSFIKPTKEERNNAVNMKLSVIKEIVKGKRLVLIDDSIVRGTTMNHIVTMLKKAGALEVHVRVSSPPFLFPCYYGTDVPSSGQLIASTHSVEDVCKSIGADSLGYLKISDFKYMVGDMDICSACFDEKYPII